MILEVSRGHIKVKIGERTATIPGEMFFPKKDKLGFAVFSNSIKNWDPPDQTSPITPEELAVILDEIRADFQKGGHTLEVE